MDGFIRLAESCSAMIETPSSTQTRARILAGVVLAAALGPMVPARSHAQAVTVSSVSLSASCPITLGSSAYWSASASGGTASLEYQFWLHDHTAGTWTLLRTYAQSAWVSWQATAPGTYTAQVWVRSVGSAASYEAWKNSAPCEVVPVAPTTVTSLSATPVSPSSVGTPVTWTAQATGGVPPLQYKFWVRDDATGTWTVLQEYGPSNQVTWIPAVVGTYTVQVWVRSVRSTTSYEAWKGGRYLVPRPGITARVSVATSGTQGNYWSSSASISADGGFVAFSSAASNLVSGDTNSQSDVFVRDRLTGTTTRVSVGPGGAQGNGVSGWPAISADGRWVAFSSDASTLVAGDTNLSRDVFVHDRQTGATARVSIASDGTQREGSSDWPSISADGRLVAFCSYASNLVRGDTNSHGDVFVHDRQTGMTTRVSVAPGGTEGNRSSYAPAISADGRFIVFESEASNLVSGDTNNTGDIFVYDRQTGMTTRISVASDGSQGNAWSERPSISADGRFVAFVSYASNLVSGDTNNTWDVFVRDRQTGATARVSVAADGAQGNTASGNPSISADGRFVAFYSSASNLVSGDTNDTWDIFAYDRHTETVARVSVSSDGAQASLSSYDPSISADGRFVAFYSYSPDLVSGDTNGFDDVFVRDRSESGAATVLLVSPELSAGSAGTVVTWTAYAAGGAGSLEYKFWLYNGSTGTWMVLREYAPSKTVMWTPDAAGTYVVQVWVRSAGAAAVEAWRNSAPFVVPAFSPVTIAAVTSNVACPAMVGHWVHWTVTATGGTQPLQYKFWLRDETAGTWAVLQEYGSSNRVSWRPAAIGSYALQVWVRSAGSAAAFDAWLNSGSCAVIAPNPVTITSLTRLPPDSPVGSAVSWWATAVGGIPPLEFKFYLRNETTGTWALLREYSTTHWASTGFSAPGTYYVQVWVRSAGSMASVEAWQNSDPVVFVRSSTTRVSISTYGIQSTGWSDMASISADGRFVAFASDASNLVTPDMNGAWDVFLHDRQTGTTSRESVAGGLEGNGQSYAPSISADGRFVAFTSDAANLVSNDTNGLVDVFVRDRFGMLGVPDRVSVASDGTQGTGASYAPSISAAGRFVAFESDAPNLVSADTNGQSDVFVRDRQTGTTTRVSVATGGTQGAGSSYAPSISADGRFVAFDSDAANLVSGDTNGTWDVFVRDLQTGTTTRVSVASGGAQGSGASFTPSISADGRFVAFDSEAANLVTADTNGTWDVFVHDRQTGTTTRVSVDKDGTEGTGASWGRSISADGRFVAFLSFAPNLATSDMNNAWDVFVHDRQSATTRRVSVSSGDAEAVDSSYGPSISADGRFIAFTSTAANLAGLDTNGTGDVFVRDRGEASAPLVLLVSYEVGGPGIIWKAFAAGGTAPLEYKFFLYNHATATWSLLRDYAPVSTVGWTPAAGTYQVQVWVRSAGSSASYEAWQNSAVVVFP